MPEEEAVGKAGAELRFSKAARCLAESEEPTFRFSLYNFYRKIIFLREWRVCVKKQAVN